MSTPEELWWDVHAGEYVLGTLDAKARELFERILRHDRALQRSVREWEHRLAPLDGTTPPREPPERVWRGVERLLRAELERRRPARDAHAEDDAVTDEGNPSLDVDPVRAGSSEPVEERAGEHADGRTDQPAAAHARRAVYGDAVDELVKDSTLDTGPLLDESVSMPPLPRTPVHERASAPNVPPLARRRANPFVALVAAFATAASLVLGALLFEQRQRYEALQGSSLRAEGIGVILGESGAPLWLVQADFSGERVRVTTLAPPPAGGGGDYQLWQILPDGGGVGPVALLPREGGESEITSTPGLVRRFDAFAVSLEPPGGSPGVLPSGAVLYQAGVTFPDETEEVLP